MNSIPKISALPLELSSKVLQPLTQEHEPVICLQIPSVGNFTPFRMRGRTNRTYRFEWDRRQLCHVLRIPTSLWSAENATLAKDIFHQVLMRPVIPTVELPSKQTEAPAPPEKTDEPKKKPSKSRSKPSREAGTNH